MFRNILIVFLSEKNAAIEQTYNYRSNSLKDSELPKFLLSGEIINEVDSYKYLGHFITKDLTDDMDIKRQSHKLFSQANILLRKFRMCSADVKDEVEDLHGHSMQDAVQLLHSELTSVLRNHERDQKRRPLLDHVSFLRRSDRSSAFHWSNIVLMATLSFALFLAYGLQDSRSRDHWLIAEGAIILSLLGLNILSFAFDHYLKSREYINKAQGILNAMKDSTEPHLWEAESFLDIHSPLSPCVSLQWTVRGGQLLNLPTCLLVEGDVILLRPGQIVPSHCSALLIDEGMEDEEVTLHEGDTYKPFMYSSVSESQESVKTSLPGQTKPVTALKPKPFLVKETPFAENLRNFLARSLSKPISSLNTERYNLYTNLVEKWIIPLSVIISLIINIARFILMKGAGGHWTTMLLVQQVHIVLPLAANVLSLSWRLLDIFGLAQLLCIFESLQEIEYVEETSNFSSHSTLASFDESLNPPVMVVLRQMCNILTGQTDCLPRSVNVLHVLGNITSLCCIDKKGILSWPNPTAEKVFFLTQKSVAQKHADVIKPDANDSDLSETESHTELAAPVTGFQVLDLSQDPKNAYGLRFDDPNWKAYISSLKPLGLDILLNTCNMDTTDRYTQFGDHVTCASIKQEIQVPVVNRRCFCELSRQIGFGDQASSIFATELTMGMYRHIPEECDWKSRMMRTPGIQYKMPMPNMFSVIVNDSASETQQLFSQGTADLMLDTCTDFWDGCDVISLTDAERRRILDFYHRTSMSSYCTAFAYRPLSVSLSSDLNRVYLEVGEDAHKFHPMAPTHMKARSCQSLDNHSADEVRGVNTSGAYYGSIDSLLNANSCQTVNDMPGCMASQCGQIFIGMITMQYQAKQDIVSTIEALEASCIRFVHFSKENELRSRVFSEKMGLEAGWNCHISLLSESEERTGAGSSAHGDWQPSTASSVSHPNVSHDSSMHHRHTSNLSLRERRRSAPGGVSLNNSLAKSSSHRSHLGTQELAVKEEDEEEGDAAETSLTQHINHSRQGTEELATNESVNMSVSSPLLDKNSSHGRHAMTSDPAAATYHHKGHCSIDSEHGSSFFTENTDSMAGFSNRAKLPKGIENIRSHIEHVDNVPLQVSLFTDCNPSNTTEMLAIFQDYGEVVCCLGSTANIRNTPMFLQADAGIGLEPLYPQICMKHNAVKKEWTDSGHVSLGPLEMSTQLNTLPCVFTVNKANCLLPLISVARHHCQQVRNAFLFLLMCQLSLTILQLLASLLPLPPLLSPHLLLWLTLVVVPCLGLCLVFTPPSSQIAYSSHSKKTKALSRQVAVQFTVYFAVRFLPTLLVGILFHGLNLNSFCQTAASQNNSTCHVLLGNSEYNSSYTWSGWSEEYEVGLVISQNIVAFHLLLAFVLSSMCYMHRIDHLWKRSPHINTVWCCISVTLIVLQVLYFTIDVYRATKSVITAVDLMLSDVPIATWVAIATWPIILIACQELIKHFEIKSWVRYQKRARLDFDTKLGMNSPF